MINKQLVLPALTFGVFPFVRYVLAFLAGILLYLLFQLVIPVWIIILLFLFFTGCVLFIPASFFLYQKLFAGLFGLLLLVALGNYRTKAVDAPSLTNFEQITAYQVETIGPSTCTKSSCSTLTQILTLLDSAGNSTAGKQKVILRTDTATVFETGQLLWVLGSPNRVKAPQNPGAFNYRRFLQNRQILYQQYCTSREMIVSGSTNPSFWIRFINNLQQYVASAIDKYVEQQEVHALSKAFLLGTRNELPVELEQTYAASGTMHILAVSGLHVGILYLLLAFTGSYLFRGNYGKVINLVVVLTGLWCYAGITGFSPSVSRAATMFSIIATGNQLNRSANVYNSLAVSAFLFLCINPFLITQIGFQLSYLAVLSIVFWQPRLDSMLTFRHRLPRKIWQLITVSLAAQLGTGLLSIYYFNQFPLYFLLANLVAVPAAFCMLCLNGLLIFTSPLPFLARVVANVLETFTGYFHHLLQEIEQLPWAVISYLYLDEAELALGYLFIILLGTYWPLQCRQYYYSALLLLMFLLGYRSVQYTRPLHQFRVYAWYGEPVADLLGRKGNTLLWAGDEQNNKSIMEHVIHPGRMAARVAVPVNEDKPVARWEKQGMDAYFSGTISILHLKEDILFSEPISVAFDDRPVFDFVVISNNALRSLDELYGVMHCKQIIIDSSNYPDLASRLARQAAELGWTAHDVTKEGAFIADIP